MTTNPSHILIARNSRGAANPSASLSSPTETHAAAAGIFADGTAGVAAEPDADVVSELSIADSSQGPIDVDRAFTPHSEFPSIIKIIVESTTFWAHREVLWFASPFFQAALSGNWAETGGRPGSVSSVITPQSRPLPVPVLVPGDKPHAHAHATTFAPVDADDTDIVVFESSDAEESGDDDDGAAAAAHQESSSVATHVRPHRARGL
ncbi:hypothetical protein BC834DRAFT_1035987 [Gloeopeniophorella convolvens]|nr:hypothetical protein BC834DRAFT_1035987 [Gloeopeniophorella convolvens]